MNTMRSQDPVAVEPASLSLGKEAAESKQRRATLVDAYGRRGSLRPRKPSAATVRAMEKALDDPVTVVQVTELSEADRRLAEMGYAQVCLGPLYE